MGARLSEDEVQRALDFCVHLFDPTTPEQHESARRKIELASGLVGAVHDPAVPDADPLRLLDVRAPVVDPVHLEQLLRQQLHLQENLPASPSGAHGGPPRPPDIVTQELSMVLNKVNARRVIHAEHGNGLNSLEEEELAGYALRLRRGELGLRRAGGDKGAGTQP